MVTIICDILLSISALTRLSVLPDNSTTSILNVEKQGLEPSEHHGSESFLDTIGQLNDNIPENSSVNQSTGYFELLAS